MAYMAARRYHNENLNDNKPKPKEDTNIKKFEFKSVEDLFKV